MSEMQAALLALGSGNAANAAKRYKYLHKDGHKESDQTPEAIADALANGEFRNYKVMGDDSLVGNQYPVWVSGTN